MISQKFLENINLSSFWLIIILAIFVFSFTIIGASAVFLMKKSNNKTQAASLGMAAGIMIAATFWSLLNPALEYAKEFNNSIFYFLPVVFGFLTGGFLLYFVDKTIPHIHVITRKKENVKKDDKKSESHLLLTAMTIHNIPEGFAIGIALGSFLTTMQSNVLNSGNLSFLISAIILAIGIGIQDIPEATAVALSLYASGKRKARAFWISLASGLVEIFGLILGIVFLLTIQNILAFSLAFSAGAMIYVTVEEVLPQAQNDEKNNDIVSIFVIIGFIIMMSLDVLLS